jgi:hypothetical protein
MKKHTLARLSQNFSFWESTLRFLIVTFFLLSLINCGGDSESLSTLSIIDITDAKSLFIAPDGASISRAAAGEDRIFKITEDGYVQEVNYFDDSGNRVTSVKQPRNIIALNEDFILIGFGGAGIVSDLFPFDPRNDNYLVNIHTGAAYIYPSMEQTNTFSYSNLPYNIGEIKTSIKADKIGNVYFINDSSSDRPNRLKKLSLTNTTVQTWSVLTDQVLSFGVDGDGNLAYYGQNDSGEPVYRYKKASGDLENPFFSSSLFWQGLQGELFCLEGSQIKKFEANPYVAVNYGASIFGGFSQITRMEKKNKIIALGENMGENALYEVYNTSSDPRVIPLSNFNLGSAKSLASSDDFYYLVGRDMTNKEVLVKINPEDDSYITLLDGDVYAEIYKLVASSQDVITFNALKMPKGTVVLSTIDTAGTIKELAAFESELTVLQRIN